MIISSRLCYQDCVLRIRTRTSAVGSVTRRNLVFYYLMIWWSRLSRDLKEQFSFYNGIYFKTILFLQTDKYLFSETRKELSNLAPLPSSRFPLPVCLLLSFPIRLMATTVRKMLRNELWFIYPIESRKGKTKSLIIV